MAKHWGFSLSKAIMDRLIEGECPACVDDIDIETLGETLRDNQFRVVVSPDELSRDILCRHDKRGDVTVEVTICRGAQECKPCKPGEASSELEEFLCKVQDIHDLICGEERRTRKAVPIVFEDCCATLISSVETVFDEDLTSLCMRVRSFAMTWEVKTGHPTE